MIPIPASLFFGSKFLKYLLNNSKDHIIAKYSQAKNAEYKYYDFYFDSSCMVYHLVSHWVQKDYPNIGDTSQYAFDMTIFPQVIQKSGLLTQADKEEFKKIQKGYETKVKETYETIEGNPFDGDPMFQE
jgi:hypothetical protein